MVLIQEKQNADVEGRKSLKKKWNQKKTAR